MDTSRHSDPPQRVEPDPGDRMVEVGDAARKHRGVGSRPDTSNQIRITGHQVHHFMERRIRLPQQAVKPQGSFGKDR
jgi:hypothetical protein